MKHLCIGLSFLSIFLTVALTKTIVVYAASGVPNVVNYQGTLQDDAGNPVTAEKVMSFRIYPAMDTPKANALWVSGDMTIQVNQGRFSINMGDTTGIPSKIPAQPAFPADLFKDDTRYLGITVDGTELLERKKLVSVPYALSAGSGGIPKGIIVMWSGATVPEGWALCDGQNGTPDLRNRFVLGAGGGYGIGTTGGNSEINLAHSHTINDHTHSYSGNTGAAQGDVVNRTKDNNLYTTAGTAHYHSYSGTTGGASDRGTNSQLGNTNILPPYYALAFIMKL